VAYRASIAALASAILAACSNALPPAGQLPDFKASQQETAEKFTEVGPPAVERIRVPASSMKPRSAKPPIPAHIASMPIDVKFPGNHEATVGALVQTLSAVNLQVGFQWTSPDKGQEILAMKLPFLGFQGTVGELLGSLRTGIGIVAWYENGMIFLSDRERFSVSLPQNKDLLEAVANEVKSLGATDVVTSIRGGKLLYSATPPVQDDIIGPFLKRMSRNLAVVNLQIAVVSLALNDKSSAGFDWNAFSVAFDSTKKAIDAATGIADSNDTGSVLPGTGTGGTGIGSGTFPGSHNNGSSSPSLIDRTRNPAGTIIDLTGGGIAFTKTNLGTVVGTYGALTVAGAINFLSNFGNTNITQNVSLKTLSGSEVSLRSGQEVPYVTGVSTTATANSSGTIGSSNTDTVETGLTIKTTPHYDADAALVTLDMSVELKSILDYVELNAGRDIGTFTQPLTQDQSLTDIVRVEAGKTVVIGGLQSDSETTSGVEPTFLRERLEKTGRSLGSRSSDVQRNALFIILRPSVTIYEPAE